MLSISIASNLVKELECYTGNCRVSWCYGAARVFPLNGDFQWLSNDLQGVGLKFLQQYLFQVILLPEPDPKLQNKVHFCKHGKNVVCIDVFQTMAS